MRTVKISDELFEQLKDLVVDPFDDTPDLVIGRLIEIVKKAKSRWSPLDAYEAPDVMQAASRSHRKDVSPPRIEEEATAEEDQVVLL